MPRASSAADRGPRRKRCRRSPAQLMPRSKSASPRDSTPLHRRTAKARRACLLGRCVIGGTSTLPPPSRPQACAPAACWIAAQHSPRSLLPVAARRSGSASAGTTPSGIGAYGGDSPLYGSYGAIPSSHHALRPGAEVRAACNYAIVPLPAARTPAGGARPGQRVPAGAG
ncbi:MAG: hypothetical protein J3K34DRAFT_424157 [Monoraphidium minutum]|nr:MAG: hypothetical protein J3K34DRAFT_424157 [Monoraphidium minutum]